MDRHDYKEIERLQTAHFARETAVIRCVDT